METVLRSRGNSVSPGLWFIACSSATLLHLCLSSFFGLPAIIRRHTQAHVLEPTLAFHVAQGTPGNSREMTLFSCLVGAMGTASIETREAVCTAAPPPANDPVQTCTLLRSRSWLKARGAYGLRYTGTRGHTAPQRHSHGGLGFHKDQQVASVWGVTRSPTVPW